MECMRCKTRFSESDIREIRKYNELPICDECLYQDFELIVEYDGTEDLLVYLKEHVNDTKNCINCGKGKLNLLRIVFGNPINGYTRCDECKTEDQLDIYLEMV